MESHDLELEIKFGLQELVRFLFSTWLNKFSMKWEFSYIFEYDFVYEKRIMSQRMFTFIAASTGMDIKDICCGYFLLT